MVWGGCKNFLGCHKSCDHNVIVHPGIAARASGSRRCQTDDNKVFANQYHDNNHCMTQDGVFYTMNIEVSVLQSYPCFSILGGDSHLVPCGS